MAAVLPEGTGARLVAAYSRDDLEERYAFCRTKAGKTFFFARAKDGEPYGTPTEARESDNGYVVDFAAGDQLPLPRRRSDVRLTEGAGSRAGERSCGQAHEWGGWDSNPRPTDYESAALTG